MFVYWKPDHSTVRRHRGKPAVLRVRAVLRSCVRVDGRPVAQYHGNLASYRISTRTTLPTRVLFWANAQRRLEQLDLTPKQRKKVEAALAVRVRRPTRKQIERCAI